MLQQGRRSDPYPYTWEIPAAISLGVVIAVTFGLQVGRALANLTAGRGWTWPAGRNLFTSLGGILHGDAGAGLPGTGWASPTALMICLAMVELIVLAGITIALIWGMRRWGPQRMKGMARADQAETTLGLTRLRKVRSIIRPDLYAPSRTPSGPRGGHDGYHPTA